MTLMKPWPRGEQIRSPWGPRVHPISGKRKHHRGVDVAYHGPIYAPADGVVVHKGSDLNNRTGGGYVLILRHDQPRVWTVYYHMREPSPLLKGTKVTQGEILGHTGTTGASTGVHLHFETRNSRRWGTDFDPTTILSHEHASERPTRGPERPTESPAKRERKPQKVYGISGAWKAMDVRSVNRFLRGRR
jgi:murein DD-endopeptidase MepM/ murein hydrolase activator NlpD